MFHCLITKISFYFLYSDMKCGNMFSTPNGWLLLFWGLLAFCTIGCRGCPLPPDTECQCEVNDQNQRIINCRHKQLQRVPEFSNTSEPIYELTLYGCMIKELPANAFSVLNVERIDLGEKPHHHYPPRCLQWNR